MDEIEKIRRKIKELQNEFISIHPKDCSLELIKSYAGYVYLDKVLSFLDTLENSDAKKDEKVPTRIYLGNKYEFIRRDIILKEIEGMKKNNEVSDDKEYAPYELDVACGYDMACDDVLSFLNFHKSEKPINMDEELNEEIKKEMVKLPFLIRGKDQIAYARHFAEWGAEHLKK